MQHISVGGEDIDIGGNASAEGGGDEIEAEVEKVLDVVSAGRLQQTNFGKGDFLTLFKGYMKKTVKSLKADAPDKVDGFKTVCHINDSATAATAASEAPSCSRWPLHPFGAAPKMTVQLVRNWCLVSY